jgi:hypothetical protein
MRQGSVLAFGILALDNLFAVWVGSLSENGHPAIRAVDLPAPAESSNGRR